VLARVELLVEHPQEREVVWRSHDPQTLGRELLPVNDKPQRARHEVEERPSRMREREAKPAAPCAAPVLGVGLEQQVEARHLAGDGEVRVDHEGRRRLASGFGDPTPL
jgi:hypothetical protein